MKFFYASLLFLFHIALLNGQTKKTTIAILNDGDRGTLEFMDLLKQEVDLLISREYDVEYKEFSLAGEVVTDNLVNEAFSSNSDLVIGLGLISSQVLSSLNSYSKPCIAGLSLQKSGLEKSGKDNYTFIESPFSVEKDLKIFRAIFPFKKLGIFIAPKLKETIEPYLRLFSSDFEVQFVSISDSPSRDILKLDDDVDAIYYLPNLYEEEDFNSVLINEIKIKKLPSFSLIGRREVERGILASISPSDYIESYARRLAINIMKVLDGQNPKDFPVKITGAEDDFVINARTMNEIEVFPPFQVLNKASLVDIGTYSGIEYTLNSAIATAINNNLSLKLAKNDIEIQDKEVKIARSNLLPDVSVNTTLVTLDQTSSDLLVAANQLTPQTSWAGNLLFSQLIYSQPAWANVAIQNDLFESEKAGFLSQQLDLILDISVAYIQSLQAEANVDIQNSNVQTTLRNLNVAKTMAKIGTVSNADVLGFESQLSLNKISLNDAQTALRQAKIRINQLLNKPLDEEIYLNDILEDQDIIFLNSPRIREQIQNINDFRQFANFLIDYGIKNVPAIEQLNWAIEAQNKSLNINKASLYVPQIGLQANVDKTLGRYGTKIADQNFEAIGIDPYQPTWNIGLSASLPIFQGNLRKNKIQRDKIQIEKLQTNKANVELSFASNIRLSLENLSNSYNDILYTSDAEKSSISYLSIIEDLYKEGVTNIVTLLDAQNNAVASQLAAVSSQYQFIIDAITIERLINHIHILSSNEEKEKFINDYFDYLLKNDKDE